MKAELRRAQLVGTYGPGALIDLPNDSAIVGGLEMWPKTTKLREIQEARLAQKVALMTGVPAPRFYGPPIDSDDPNGPQLGIKAPRFPNWFVSQFADGENRRSRRLVHKNALDERRRFEGRPVVATRFVCTCPRGHVDDLDWYRFVHGSDDPCKRPLWLDERGTSGELGDLTVRCECGKTRRMVEAKQFEELPLGYCSGKRPWLGPHAGENCTQPGRLLIRTASNAYFPQVMSALSLPERGAAVDAAVSEQWSVLSVVDNVETLATFKKLPQVMAALAPFADAEILAAIERRKQGGADPRPVKIVELDAILAAPQGFGDDIPVDEDFHARCLPDHVWRDSAGVASTNVEAVIQLHRLREVVTLVGFTRLEAEMPDIFGEYESDVTRATIAREPSWFPAVENRGEGLFVQLRADAIDAWLERPAVAARLDDLVEGHLRWCAERKSERAFPGGPYILLHTLSHLLIQSLGMRSGYPASSIRERIYADEESRGYGLLLYTSSSDAEGTLGGLVQEARHFEYHLAYALGIAELCSNDPICSQHSPGTSLEERWLHGAACHGCALIAETSCEMRNDYLDRALVGPVLGVPDVAFLSRT